MQQKLRSLYMRTLLDRRYIGLRRALTEIRRQMTLQKRIVHVFLQIDDPYSYLLSHYLEFVQQRYKRVEFRYYLCQALRGEFAPQPVLQEQYALTDCRALAEELGVPFLDRGAQPVVKLRRPLLDFLADEHEDEDFLQTFQRALSAYWRGDEAAVLQLIDQAMPEQSSTNVLVGKHQLLLRKMGHYSCASMHYAGEWFVGVDRLQHLTDRFAEQGLNRYSEATPELSALAQVTEFKVPQRRPAHAGELPPLEMFYSFRSPYSYIALARTFEFADALGLKLEVRPVLPMVMRGLSVPKSKLLYLAWDANREAERLGIPFGRIADPVGIGVERCIAAFYHAHKKGKTRRFLAVAGEAIWSRAIDVATDEGMQQVAEKVGLEWSELREALEDDGWRASAEANREALFAEGLWGVPSFRIGKLLLWGQDRLWLLARRGEDLCRESGEPIE